MYCQGGQRSRYRRTEGAAAAQTAQGSDRSKSTAKLAGVAGLEPATPGFGDGLLRPLLVSAWPVMTVWVLLSRMRGRLRAPSSCLVFPSSVAKMVAMPEMEGNTWARAAGLLARAKSAASCRLSRPHEH